MKSIIYLLILLSPSFLNAQDWLEDKEDLKGNVKKVHYTRAVFFTEEKENWWTIENNYEYNINGFLIRSSSVGNASGKFDYGIFRVFDDSDEKCQIEYDLNYGDTTSKCLYVYNYRGQIEKSNYYRNNELWNTSYYTYNKAGFLSQKLAITIKNDSLWDKYKYDVVGRMIEYVDSSKSLYVLKTWEFDDKDRLIEVKSQKLKMPKPIVITIGDNGTILDEKKVDRIPKDEDHLKITYVYNEKNQILQEIRDYLDSDEGFERIYLYNEQGEVSSITSTDLNSKDKNITTITYEYDLNGNWTSKKYYWNGEYNEIETREIEYY